jgi:hypothetical protein
MGDGGSEPIGPAAHHQWGAHATASDLSLGGVIGRVQVTFSGMGPLGSHGCCFTASATFQVPRSSTPSAASMTLLLSSEARNSTAAATSSGRPTSGE